MGHQEKQSSRRDGVDDLGLNEPLDKTCDLLELGANHRLENVFETARCF